MAPPRERDQRPLADQDVPVIQVVGRITSKKTDNGGDSETGVTFLVHTGWSRDLYQVSSRGMKVLRNLGIRVIDDPGEYNV